MIRVDRDRLDSKKVQQDLEHLRLVRLPKLRKLIKDGRQNTDEFRGLLTGYKEIARKHLYDCQHQKCCYCEKWEEESFNDVEHYRPKSIYWWLTFTWTNLLFACKQCNRSEKNALFPLRSGDALQAESFAFDTELPQLLDPSDARTNPVEHIQFTWKPYFEGGPNQWVAEGRPNSQYGGISAVVYGLNRDDLFELRKKHVTQIVKPAADTLNRHLDEGNDREAKFTFEAAMKSFEPAGYFVGLTYDAFRHFVKDAKLKAILCEWPTPAEIGIMRARRPTRRPPKSS